MSCFLNSLRPGAEIQVLLPFGLMQYIGHGTFKKSKQELHVRDVAMIAAGSGITPMLRLLEASLADQQDETKFSMIFANRTEEHIICRDRLEELAALHRDRFKLVFTLSNGSKDWTGTRGYVTREMIATHLPQPSDHVLTLLCGPPAMLKGTCKDLEALGYATKQTWEF